MHPTELAVAGTGEANEFQESFPHLSASLTRRATRPVRFGGTTRPRLRLGHGTQALHAARHGQAVACPCHPTEEVVRRPHTIAVLIGSAGIIGSPTSALR